MPAYEVRFVDSAAKEFRSLPAALKGRVTVAIDGLGQNPRPFGVRKLAGAERLYRIRVGEYRVVYEIDDDSRVVTLTRVRHRRESYR